MKIRYLGTAAAEGFPGLFCACENCKKAWRLGGRNIRSRSQAIVDDSLLIDFPADTFMHTVRYGIDLTSISHCLITHSHMDHLHSDDFENIHKGFSWPPKDWGGFHVYGNREVSAILEPIAAQSDGDLISIPVDPFVPFQAGAYTVTALKALHGTQDPYIYIISDGKSTLLYAHDTDIFPAETWDYLKACGVKFDLVSMDCTEGSQEALPYQGHMCLGSNRRCREMLLEIGAADKNTKFVLNHFSHNGLQACYDDFVPIAEADGFLVSYDGMEEEC